MEAHLCSSSFMLWIFAVSNQHSTNGQTQYLFWQFYETWGNCQFLKTTVFPTFLPISNWIQCCSGPYPGPARLVYRWWKGMVVSLTFSQDPDVLNAFAVWSSGSLGSGWVFVSGHSLVGEATCWASGIQWIIIFSLFFFFLPAWFLVAL